MKTSQACYVTYMYGSNQAMAMVVELKLVQSFDPYSLNLPSMGALVGFYHACVGFPVKQTWLDTIIAGNFDSVPGLTYSNAAQYCPDANETITGHLAQQRPNVRSTKPKCPVAVQPPVVPVPLPEQKPLHQVFVQTYLIRKIYTDNTGQFLIKARSGNQHLMIAYHEDGNLILQ